MKTKSKFTRVFSLMLTTGGIAWLAPSLTAAPFVYNPGDLLLSFRQVGGASDLVVNIGSAATYSTLAGGNTIAITNLSSTQFSATFPDVNALVWSVVGADRAGVSYPLQTLWATAPRADINIQTSPWIRQSVFAQGSAASIIDGLGVGVATYSANHPADANNTATGVAVSSSDANAYTPHVSGAFYGNFDGSFQGNVENITPDDFDTSGSPSRSDLYELLPGAGPTINTAGRYLGYFEFHADGALTFNTITPLVQPQITSLQRNGNTVTVSFPSVTGTNYRLRSTDSAGLTAPVSSWNISGSTIAGNGAVLSLQETGVTTARFYVVEALH